MSTILNAVDKFDIVLLSLPFSNTSIKQSPLDNAMTGDSVSSTGASSHELQICHVSLYFLDRDHLYDEEKPYTLQYDPGDGIPSSNVKQVLVPGIKLQDLRKRSRAAISFEKSGIDVLRIKDSLDYEGFSDPIKVTTVYLDEIQKTLMDYFGARKIHLCDYVVNSTNSLSFQ